MLPLLYAARIVPYALPEVYLPVAIEYCEVPCASIALGQRLSV
jgi:hypothetical protein